MKRLGKRLFRGAAALLLGLLLPWGARAAWVSPFVDVTGEDWFCPAVEYVVEAGLFQGTAPDRFSPAGPMTRGMFVTVLGRAVQAEGEGAGPSPFEDVAEDAYYAPYVAWAAGAGVVNGTSPTTFSPEEQVTREQMAVMLYQYGQAYDLDVSFAEGALDRLPRRGTGLSLRQGGHGLGGDPRGAPGQRRRSGPPGRRHPGPDRPDLPQRL